MAEPAALALTRGERLRYAAGMFPVNLLGLVITQWALKFYLPDDPARNLVPAAWASWILTLGRFTDGLNDPLIGYLSDRARTRWGRRKPFMAIGLPLIALFFVLLWYPPVGTESMANFVYATLVLIGFFVAFTLYVGPYLALLPEIVATTPERLSLSALQGVFGLAGLVAGGLLPGLALNHGLTMRGVAWLVTGLAVVLLALPLAGPRERATHLPATTPSLGRSLALTFQSRPFQRYVGAQVLFHLGLLTIVSALPYWVERLLGRPTGDAGYLTGVALLAGVAFVPLILKVARRKGIKFAYRLAMAQMGVAATALALLGLWGLRPWGLALAYLLVLFVGVGVGGIYSLPNAIVADITAHDRLRTGLDRQGMFYCVQGLVLKLAYAGAPFIVGQMLYHFPDHKRLALSLIGPLAGLLCWTGMWIFRGYPEAEVAAAVGAVGGQPSKESVA